MWRQFPPDAGLLSIRAQDLPEALARHICAQACDEEIIARMLFQEQGPAVRDVLRHFRQRFFSDGDNALLVLLSYARENAEREIQLRNGQVHQLAYSKTRGLQDLYHRAVSASQSRVRIRLLEQSFDLFPGQIMRKRFERARGIDLLHRVVSYYTIDQ